MSDTYNATHRVFNVPIGSKLVVTDKPPRRGTSTHYIGRNSKPSRCSGVEVWGLIPGISASSVDRDLSLGHIACDLSTVAL
ncbi:hypothetical protein TNCV_1146801 [Trichonephila clavipes]|nr:hypothetical protein TNCV_1146801 [Trichonephila clavipes]